MRSIPTIAAIMEYALRARVSSWTPPPQHLIVKPGSRWHNLVYILMRDDVTIVNGYDVQILH